MLMANSPIHRVNGRTTVKFFFVALCAAKDEDVQWAGQWERKARSHSTPEEVGIRFMGRHRQKMIAV